MWCARDTQHVVARWVHSGVASQPGGGGTAYRLRLRRLLLVAREQAAGPLPATDRPPCPQKRKRERSFPSPLCSRSQRWAAPSTCGCCKSGIPNLTRRAWVCADACGDGAADRADDACVPDAPGGAVGAALAVAAHERAEDARRDLPDDRVATQINSALARTETPFGSHAAH